MNLVGFVAWCIREGLREGNSLDSWDVQDKAVEFGILERVTYDPEKHGPNDIDAEPGDEWYVFSDEMKMALTTPERETS